jgi:hypothetical protein
MSGKGTLPGHQVASPTIATSTLDQTSEFEQDQQRRAAWTHFRSAIREQQRAPRESRIPRRAGLVESSPRCACDNEGGSAFAVASHPELGSSTPGAQCREDGRAGCSAIDGAVSPVAGGPAHRSGIVPRGGQDVGVGHRRASGRSRGHRSQGTAAQRLLPGGSRGGPRRVGGPAGRRASCRPPRGFRRRFSRLRGLPSALRRDGRSSGHAMR